MMQHYRTHMSPKSRRSQRGKANGAPATEEPRPRPRLHAHHRIRSDPFRVEPPLTIDQHLSNYHRSLLTPSARTERFSPTRYNNHQQQQQQQASPIARPSPVAPVPVATTMQHVSPSSTQPLAGSTNTSASATPATPMTPLMASSSTTTPVINVSPSPAAPAIVSSSSTPSTTTTPLSSTPSSSSPPAVFYQHRPLTTNLSLLDHPAGQAPPFPFTLLHPPVRKGDDDSSSDGLRQLAHVVSTFG